MTEQVEKVGRPKCDHCGREYYQHIQADGMRLCPVSAFAYRPASSTPPDDSVARIVAWLRNPAETLANGYKFVRDTEMQSYAKDFADAIERGDWK